MDANVQEERATYRRMSESTKRDWEIIGAHAAAFNKDLPNRILDHLRLLKDDHGGFPVTRLEHSTQMATMVHKAGKDEEYVVCALLHDIGDTLASFNHGDIAAALLKPFVSEENHWIVEQHPIFQGYYFFEHFGLDPNMREQFRGHPHFEACADFCKFDQAAFDANYDSMPLEAFEPMVHRVFSRPKRSIYLRTE